MRGGRAMDEREAIISILKHFEVTRAYQGFDYVAYGVELVIKDRSYLKYVTKTLYPEIARKYRTSWHCVERDIRTVADIVWKNGGGLFFRETAKEMLEERPKNAKFIQLMADYVVQNGPVNEKNYRIRCDGCLIIKDLEDRIKTLELENAKLNSTVEWMHNLIWDMIKKNRKK